MGRGKTANVCTNIITINATYAAIFLWVGEIIVFQRCCIILCSEITRDASHAGVHINRVEARTNFVVANLCCCKHYRMKHSRRPQNADARRICARTLTQPVQQHCSENVGPLRGLFDFAVFDGALTASFPNYILHTRICDSPLHTSTRRATHHTDL